MALLNGQTPKEIAEDIVNPESQMLELDGYVFENLVKITKYNHKDELAVKSEFYWNKEKDNLIADTLKKLINDKEKTLTKYMDKRQVEKNMEYFRLLRAKGVTIDEAAKMAGVEL